MVHALMCRLDKEALHARPGFNASSTEVPRDEGIKHPIAGARRPEYHSMLADQTTKVYHIDEKFLIGIVNTKEPD